MHSRRDFLRLAAVSVPGCAALASVTTACGATTGDLAAASAAAVGATTGPARDTPNASGAATTSNPASRASDGKQADGVRLGVQTYSFREMLGQPGDMTDKMIAAMRQLGLTECEMFEPCLQPPGLWPPTNGNARIEAVRAWRLGPGLDEIKSHAAKLEAAGIRVFAYNYSLYDQCSDEEIVRGIQMTHALGAQIMTVSTTLPMAKRSVPFFEKDGLLLALHGHSNTSDPNQFATPASFEAGLAMSKLYRVNLDIGHFSAAGFDPVAFIQAHHDRVTNLHIKDRKRNDGPNMPFGQGDTPIKPVLQLLKREHYPIPAYIEYEYAGTGTATEEVAKCLAYVRTALATTG